MKRSCYFVRMRNAPGIAFVDGAAGGRAVIAGTGLDVWEVVASWHAAEDDLPTVLADFSWLSAIQVRAALGYYQLYPDEIDLRLQAEAAWTPEQIRRELPFLTPSRSPVPHPIQPLLEGGSGQLELIEVHVMPRLVEQVEGGVRVVA